MAYADIAALAERLGLADTIDNGLLAGALSAAESSVNLWCNRSFAVPAAVTTRLYAGWGTEVLVDDIATTTGLVVLDNTTTVNNADLVLDPANGVGPDGNTGWPYWRLRFADGHAWSVDGLKRTVSVTAKFGWAAVPENVRMATLVLAADLFHAKDTRLGIAGFGDMGIIRIRENGMLQTLLHNFVRETGVR